MPDNKDTNTSAATVDLSSVNQVVEAKLDTIRAELRGVTRIIEDFVRDVRRILDDHETRLREQASIDAAQAQQISELRLQLATLQLEVKALDVAREEARERQLNMWQQVGVELLKYVLMGGTAGGVLAAVQKFVIH